MNWTNSLTRLLQIDYPFIQAPMLLVSTPEMVAAVSNTGALGSLPLGYASPEKAALEIRAVKKLTQKPFAVNLFAYSKPAAMQETPSEALKSYYQQYGLELDLPHSDPYSYYTNVIDTILELQVPIVSFHFGLPDEETARRLKSAGIVIIAAVTSTEEAMMAESAGASLIVAQGIEAGGNRGTFTQGPLPEVGLISLLPQVIDSVKIPVIAAGGLMQPRSIAAAFVLGAQGVQLGSAFLRSTESAASNSYKTAVAASKDTSTGLSNVWSGKYGRCIPNKFVRDMEGQTVLRAPFQNYMTGKLRQVGRKEDNPEIQSLWAGQSARYASDKPTGEILTELIAGTNQILSKSFTF